MSIRFKDGVDVIGIKKETITAMARVSSYFYDFHNERDMVVTSCSDGKHMENSKHYTGEAFDIRCWTTPISGVQVNNGTKAMYVHEIGLLLGDDWDVVAETTHIHIEYDPTSS